MQVNFDSANRPLSHGGDRLMWDGTDCPYLTQSLLSQTVQSGITYF